jgi:hypothetical protein
MLVHPDRADLEPSRDLRAPLEILRPYRPHQPVVRRVRPLQRLVELTERHHRQRRTKLLLVHQPHPVRDARDDRRRIEVPRPVERRPAGDDLRPCPLGVLYECIDPLELRRVAQWPQLRVRFDARTDPHPRRDLRHRLDERLVDALVSVPALGRDAHLTGVPEGARKEPLGDRCRIRILEYDGGIVAAEFEHQALQVGCGRRRDLLASRYRPREAQHPHGRVVGDRGTEVVAARHHIEHTRRQRLLEDRAEFERCQRRVGRGLEHHRVTDEERRRGLDAG